MCLRNGHSFQPVKILSHCQNAETCLCPKRARLVIHPQEEDGFVLPESCAILRYLAQRHKVADHWYPGGFLPVIHRILAFLSCFPSSACHQPTLLEVA